MLDGTVSPTFTVPSGFHFATGTREAARKILSQSPQKIMLRLIEDQESPEALFAGLQLLQSRLAVTPDCQADLEAVADTATLNPAAISALLAHLSAKGAALHDQLETAIGSDPRLRGLVLTERAAISQIAGCWLDIVSQPATQPDLSVNVVYGHHFRWLGKGVVENSVPELRRRALTRAGVMMPAVLDSGFVLKSGLSGSTALYAAFLTALSRFPVNHYPEVIGVHVAYHALGLDERLLGVSSGISPQDLQFCIETFCAGAHARVDGDVWVEKFMHAVALTMHMEHRHLDILCEIANKAAAQSLDSRVADIIAKHAPKAGKQHDKVRVGGTPLSTTFASDEEDMQTFMEQFRKSFYLRQTAAGSCRFLQSLKFGGPMFGIFTEDQSNLFAAWAASIPQTLDHAVVLTTHRPDESDIDAQLAAIRDHAVEHIKTDDTPPRDDRELFYRLVNIENFPNTLKYAAERAAQGLQEAQVLFERGAEGRFTDGTMFDYSPDAVFQRVDTIYWDKLIGPYKPLTEIPDSDQVIFDQKTTALGNLVDGSWSYRIGNSGRYDRTSDGQLFSIHADEMGQGDIRKNHIMLIYEVLDSMDIALPHIGDPAFMDQDELPDTVYDFAINQLSLSLFPDSYYPEIVGYNLGIEMFGLGEIRMHEIQKLKHHGFSAIYEEAHLSIDNASSGHARQSAEIVVDYLEHVRRNFGEIRMKEEWVRVWNGYCSFARFVETAQIDFDTAPPPHSMVLETLTI